MSGRPTTVMPAPPNSDFILICDKDGDPQEILSGKSTIDYVFDVVQIMDKNHPDDAPHSAWQRNGSGFSIIKERL